MKKTLLKTLIIIAVCLAVGFFAGMEYKAYQVRSKIEEIIKINQQLIPTSERQQPEAQQEEFVFIEKNVRDEIKLATINFKVNGVEETQTLVGGFGTPAIAKEDAKFVVVDMSITNITNTNFTFLSDDGFRLVDSRERQFTTYRGAAGKVDNYLNVRELTPDITERGVLVYEIPQDAMSYSLMVGKGGTNETYKVILK